MNFLKKIFNKYPVLISLMILSAIYSTFKSLDFTVKNMDSNNNKKFTVEDGKQAILHIKAKYGVAMAQIIERMFRWETRHFKSGQFVNTGSAGMEIGKWSNLPKDKIESYVYKANDADLSDGIDSFIVWKHPKYAAEYLAEYIKRNGGNWARWNTTNPEKQKLYASKVNTIKTQFV